MSGPIIRSGPSPKFVENWDSVFGGKSEGKAKKATAKPEPKAAAKPAKAVKAAVEKPAAKAAKKPAKKKAKK